LSIELACQPNFSAIFLIGNLPRRVIKVKSKGTKVAFYYSVVNSIYACLFFENCGFGYKYTKNHMEIKDS